MNKKVERLAARAYSNARCAVTSSGLSVEDEQEFWRLLGAHAIYAGGKLAVDDEGLFGWVTRTLECAIDTLNLVEDLEADSAK